jgi:hypothetical protein
MILVGIRVGMGRNFVCSRRPSLPSLGKEASGDSKENRSDESRH